MASSSSYESRSLKRKRTVVSLETKLAILHRLKRGEAQWQEYGIGKSTIVDIKKNGRETLEFCHNDGQLISHE